MNQKRSLKKILKPSNIKLVPAEKVVTKYRPEKRKRIEKAYKSRGAKKIIKLGKAGIKKFKEGKYTFN